MKGRIIGDRGSAPPAHEGYYCHIDGISRLNIPWALEDLELARGIEPPTCGLQIHPEAISTPHITPLEHTEDPDPPLG